MTERLLADVPHATSESVRRRMSAQMKRDTQCELRLRSALHRLGYRYRIHYPVPGVPRRSIDVAFPKRRVAVFIDGCFWHGCALHGTAPHSNADWWARKIARNRERDADTDNVLKIAGWIVIRIWEHEPIEHAVEAVMRALDQAE